MRVFHRVIGITIFYLLIISASGCTDEDSIVNDIDEDDDVIELSEDQQIAVEYFKEIALGFEIGNASDVTRKWNTDVIIYVAGEENEVLLSELDEILDDLNQLIPDDEIELRLTDNESESNFYVFLGKGSEYADINPSAANFVNSNFGLFFVRFNSFNYITSATMYVDTERPEVLNQRHLLREELTQSLGMAQDSPRFQDSIFQSSYSGTTVQYSQYDEAVIRMLYHPEMAPGLDEAGVDPILREIVTEVID